MGYQNIPISCTSSPFSDHSSHFNGIQTMYLFLPVRLAKRTLIQTLLLQYKYTITLAILTYIVRLHHHFLIPE